VRPGLSALLSFYGYCAAHDLIGRVPTGGVARPMVDPDYTATVGLDRDQARAPRPGRHPRRHQCRGCVDGYREGSPSASGWARR